jgi:hypothetical protein
MVVCCTSFSPASEGGNRPVNTRARRIVFWIAGLAIAAAQAWVYRYQVTADGISYLDMSDGVMPGGNWRRLITGIWSPLYPFLLGMFRRAFKISPTDEVVAGHLLNLVFFAFAFLCFEALLRRLLPESGSADKSGRASTPRWLQDTLAYALFLWASISAITLRDIRPDMLMSGFLYLAMAFLLDLRGRKPAWSRFALLGALLGVGVLAKEPMLPLSFLMFAASLFLVESWRPAMRMALASLLMVFAIGSLYFVPLSIKRGRLTLGQSGEFNYFMHVDRGGPPWYMQEPGHGSGAFTHPPLKVYSSPPAYFFGRAELVTHPLRFDPSEWMDGVHARFNFRRQVGESLDNIRELAIAMRALLPMLMALLLGIFLVPGNRSLYKLEATWPLLLIGVAGSAMYVAVHLEARYIGAFVALFFCGLLYAPFELPRSLNRNLLLICGIVIAAACLVPALVQTWVHYQRHGREPDFLSLAAVELQSLGIRPGDRVARISPFAYDLAVARAAQVEIVAEVDLKRVKEFWDAPLATQNEILRIFSSLGAKAVVATVPQLTPVNQSEWRHLGTGQEWVWFPQPAEMPPGK